MMFEIYEKPIDNTIPALSGGPQDPRLTGKQLPCFLAAYPDIGRENAIHLSLKNLDLYIMIIYTAGQWKSYLNNFQASSGIEEI